MSRAAVLRFSRDKRGYEYFSLVEPSGRGGDGGRVLYIFRTPPGVKVGRSPFDEATRRAIERHNPGVTFDWPRLVAAPVPPPPADVERWRERRRQERAEKAARAALHADEAIDPEIASEPDSMQPDSPEPDGAEPVRDERDLGGAAANQVEPSNENVASAQPGHVGRRRRRRRRRHGRSERPGPTNEARPADEPAKPSESSE